MHAQRQRQPTSSSSTSSSSTATHTATSTSAPSSSYRHTATKYRDHLRIADDTPERNDADYFRTPANSRRKHYSNNGTSSMMDDNDDDIPASSSKPVACLSLIFSSDATTSSPAAAAAANLLMSGSTHSAVSPCGGSEHMSFVDLYTNNASYKHMMDDRQLIDTCTAAQRECAEAATAIADVLTVNVQGPSAATAVTNKSAAAASHPPPRPLLQLQQSTDAVDGQCAAENAVRLRQWCSYMHEYLEAMAPGRREVLRMSTFERRVRLAEQTDLRKYIASYDRTVKRTARALPKSASGGCEAEEEDLEGVYLALLLRAIEAQCLLEGYPGMRRSAAVGGCSAIRSAEDEDEDDDDAGEPMLSESPQPNHPTATTPTDIADNDANYLKSTASVYGSAETVASSVFEPDFEQGDQRPCTSLRDELLAMAETPRSGAPNDAGSAKLSKDAVNRWLQLNLHQQPAPAVAVAAIVGSQVPIVSQQATARSQPNLSTDDRSEDLQQRSSAEITTMTGRCVSDNSIAERASGSGAFTISPSTSEEPIWDGYVDQCRPHRRPSTATASTKLMSQISGHPADETDSGVNDEDTAIDTVHNHFNDLSHVNDTGENSMEFCDSCDDVESFASNGKLTPAPLNDSFLLSAAQPRRLTLSTLKHIEDIFAVQHATPHRFEWVPPAPADGGLDGRKRSKMLPTKLPPPATLAVMSQADFDADLFCIAFLEHPNATPPEHIEQIKFASSKPPTTQRQSADKECQTISTTSKRRPRQRRRRTNPKPTTANDKSTNTSSNTHATHESRTTQTDGGDRQPTDSSTEFLLHNSDTFTLHELLENNIAAMQPADIERIVKLCQRHLDCLRHVVLAGTVNGLCGQPAMAADRCEWALAPRTAEHPEGRCRCGPIAKLVHGMVAFVADYVNAMRQWRLYRAVVAAIAQLCVAVRFVGALGVRVASPKLMLTSAASVAGKVARPAWRMVL